MEINVPIEELRKRKLFVATPMYGGMAHGMYARSLADLSAKCTRYGVSLQMYFLFNESLIQRGRNYCVDEFLRSESTHMIFIDSDIGFNADDVLMMMALQGDDTEYDVLTSPYPKKCISWEKIKRAVEKGFAEDDPNNLDRYVGDYVFNPKTHQTEIPLNQPVEVLESGTGFMMIRRKTFEVFKEKFPEQSYKPDHVRTEHFDGSREIMAYFDCVIDPETKRYLSEDYMFCQYVQKAGMKVWLLPWVRLQHAGSFIFGGSLVDIAQIGASATADVNEIKKRKV